jgi:hypothetical protein
MRRISLAILLNTGRFPATPRLLRALRNHRRTQQQHAGRLRFTFAWCRRPSLAAISSPPRSQKETAAVSHPARSALEIHETDIAIWQERETPPLSDCDPGDFTPLTAYRDVGTENEQLCAVRDTPAAGQNLFAYLCYLGVQNGLLRWGQVTGGTLACSGRSAIISTAPVFRPQPTISASVAVSFSQGRACCERNGCARCPFLSEEQLIPARSRSLCRMRPLSSRD